MCGCIQWCFQNTQLTSQTPVAPVLSSPCAQVGYTYQSKPIPRLESDACLAFPVRR